MEIKLLIFDLDGVLVNTNDVHLDALNKALASVDSSFHISQDDDIKYYGTVPTKEKLKILTKLKGFPEERHEEVIKLKKSFTMTSLQSLNLYNQKVIDCISKLKHKFKLVLASNTNYDFVSAALKNSGLVHFFSAIYCNELVSLTKPHPQMYMKCMLDAGVSPDECLIFEDSVVGQAAATRSGGHLYAVESPEDLDYDSIVNHISSLKKRSVKWKSEKMNVLIPMAGEGSRFKEADYTTPKPIIDVNGLPMVGLVAQKLNIDANFIFVVRGEHCEQYNLETLLNLMHPGCTIVKVWGKQGGAACSVLEAKKFIDNDKHLLIVNSDQIWDWDANIFYHQMIKENLDGGIVTFVDEEKNPKWSFAKTDEHGYVTEVAEKNPISNLGTAGIYYYKNGSDFVKYAEQMIVKGIRINSEFYVCPVYNEFILDSKKIKTFNCDRMIGLGIPEDLEAYLKENKNN